MHKYIHNIQEIFQIYYAHDSRSTGCLEIDGISFQSITWLKYLRINPNKWICMHNEIKLRLKASNGCLFAMLHNVFK